MKNVFVMGSTESHCNLRNKRWYVFGLNESEGIKISLVIYGSKSFALHTLNHYMQP